MVEFVERGDLIPEKLRQRYRDINGFVYKDSRIFVVKKFGEDVGAFRIAIRDDVKRKHGLITDINISESANITEIVKSIIEFAEDNLLSLGVNKIEAIVEEGKRINYVFYDYGYWPSRKSVAIGWNLEEFSFYPEPLPNGYSFDVVVSSDFSDEFINEISEFIFNSYQPYFRWWKEYKEDYRWWRTDYLDKNIPEFDNDLRSEMIERLKDYLYEIKSKNSAIIRGFVNGTLKGVCDAIVDYDENMVVGVVVDKEFKARYFGSNLLLRALKFLKDNGLSKAFTITTSGLDDYDPTVYLYTLSGKGQILSEYTILIKRKFAKGKEDSIVDIGQPLEL